MSQTKNRVVSDSQVLEALAGNPDNLERVLEHFGFDTTTKGGTFRHGARIPCPVGEHGSDACAVMGDSGTLFCHHGCGTILPLQLLVDAGRSSSRGESAKMIEKILGLAPSSRQSKAINRDPCLDPTLTVERYLAMKALPASTIHTFGLENVRIHANGDASEGDLFDDGEYTAMFMPVMDRRPRVRTARLDGKVKPASGVRHATGPKRSYSDMKQGVYGIAQLARHSTPELSGTLIVVEGESDVHTLHAAGFPNCVGIPGATSASSVDSDLLAAAAVIGEGDPGTTRVVVWSEPGNAGRAFPGLVATALMEAAFKAHVTAPLVSTLLFSDVPGKPEDFSALWMDSGTSPAQFSQLLLPALLGQVDAAQDPAAPVAKSAPPAEAPTASDAARVAAREHIDAQQRGSDDPWISLTALPNPPESHALPTQVDAPSAHFERCREGWNQVVKKDDEVEVRFVCGPVSVERFDIVAGDAHWLLVAPLVDGSGWQRKRVAADEMSSPDRLSAQLSSMGIRVAPRQRPAALDMLTIMAQSCAAAGAVRHVASTTGWFGAPGRSPFAGIESECAAQLGQRMFEANEWRRARHPDEAASALLWWRTSVEPLISQVANPSAAHAAPLLAIGAAAAAPLLGVLKDMRDPINTSAVVWLAGSGGSGKTMTQYVCASIFAPESGKDACYFSADISPAALDGRAMEARGLPLIMDDMTRVKAERNTDRSKVEAASLMAMSIYNGDAAQRSTRSGKPRASHPYNSTAIMSAELSTRTGSLGAHVTGGQIRRVTILEAQPMSDRGLTSEWAERANKVWRQHGGAAGAVLIQKIRDLVRSDDVEPVVDACRALVTGSDVTATQVSALTVQLTGFCVLADACAGWSTEEALEYARPMIEAFARDGAVTDEEVSGVDRVTNALRTLVATHGNQILAGDTACHDAQVSALPPHMKHIGRWITDSAGGRRILLTDPGMKLLYRDFDVTATMVQSCMAAGMVDKRRVRFNGERVYGHAWKLPNDYTPDDETQPPHNPDPHNLKPRIPGAQPVSEGGRADARPASVSRLACNAGTASDAPETISSTNGTQHSVVTAPEQSQPTVVAPEPEFLEIFVPEFNWSNQLYDLLDGETVDEVEPGIVTDSEIELASLRIMARAWDLEVPDPPAADDPRWAKIDEFGPEKARSIIVNCAESLTASQTAPHTERANHLAKYVRDYRLYLLARMRQPGWFVA